MVDSKSKVTSINPKVRNAVAILVSYNEGREEYDDEVSQQRLRDSLALLSEWLLCVNQNGDVTQRGHIPSVWYKDTIVSADPGVSFDIRFNCNNIHVSSCNLSKKHQTPFSIFQCGPSRLYGYRYKHDNCDWINSHYHPPF